MERNMEVSARKKNEALKKETQWREERETQLRRT